MSFLIDASTPIHGLPVDTVIHVGAGAGDAIDGYAGLSPQSLVLIEGDPETLQALELAVGHRAGTSIFGCAVAAQDGPMAWRRHNLPWLNGPLDTSALRSAYPRLRLVATVPLLARSFAAVLQEALAGSSGRNVLVMDLPGQEEALLAAVPGDLLRRFDWVVVRSCARPEDDSWCPPAASVALLHSQGFVVVDAPSGDSPLWSTQWLRFDAQGYELKVLRQELQSLQAVREEQAGIIAKQQSLIVELSEQNDDLNRGLAAQRESGIEAARQLQQATETRDLHSQAAERLGQRVTELEASVCAMNEVAEALRRQLAAAESQVQLAAGSQHGQSREQAALVAVRDEHAERVAAAKVREAQLTSELTELSARHQLLQRELLSAEAQIEFIADLMLREPKQ